ncbi:hypothetical protein LO763_22145 [Glycomyces sp. A-F 0318]|uniref:hypothetical protein n=1 Tax=Glycomyces amatae TaxID=2881355 RepID=UPI001E2DE07F|nr:hypothetical protein [Glycomyces amatae]MCD0446319.1 hypothetical protein [Glycomyces amatae]
MALTEERCAAPGCENLSTRRGEHVIPNALVRALTKAVWASGTYIAASTSGGAEAETDQPLYIKLPCCAHHNSVLSKHFEERGQKAAKQFLGITSTHQPNGTTAYAAVPLASAPPLTSEDACEFGRWIVKTLLLMHHPQAVWEMSGFERLTEPVDSQRAHLPEAVYADLFAGNVPRGCHAWIAATADQSLTEPVVAAPRVPLVTVGGNAGVPSTLGLAARHAVDGFTLVLQVVWQPDALVIHPDEETGDAVRVWPRPRAGLKLADLRVLSLEDGAKFWATFAQVRDLTRFPVGRTAVVAKGLWWVSCGDQANGHRFYALPRVDSRTRVDAVRVFAEMAGLLDPDTNSRQ